MFMSLFVVYGFDTAGTFGEETLDASRQAPRGILSAIWLSGIVGAIFLLADHPGHAGHDRRPDRGPGGGFPIATAIKIDAPRGEITFGNVYLFVILHRGLRVHPGHPGRDDAPDVLDGPRPAHAPRRRCGAQVNQHFKTPANAAIAVGVLAALPVPRLGPSPGLIATGATGLIYLSLLPVQPRRARRPAARLAAQAGAGSSSAAGA